MAQFHGLLPFSSVNPGPVNRSLARFDAQFIGNNRNPGCCSRLPSSRAGRKTLKRHRGRVSPPFFRDIYIYIYIFRCRIHNDSEREHRCRILRERNTRFAFLAAKRRPREEKREELER